MCQKYEKQQIAFSSSSSSPSLAEQELAEAKATAKRKMLGRKMCKNMHKEIRLEVDGKLIELPTVEGIIILNIMR